MTLFANCWERIESSTLMGHRGTQLCEETRYGAALIDGRGNVRLEGKPSRQ